MISAEDLALAVRLSSSALGQVPVGTWDDSAGSLEWTRWETAEHLCDDLISYALQIGPSVPPLSSTVPLAWERKRPGGPANAIFVDRSPGKEGLLQVLEGCGALLAAMVRTTPPEVRAHHIFGVSDPEGFGAMGMVETLVHTYDIVSGLPITWEPPADLCARTLDRLFPDAPQEQPWPTLLWATGRGELEGRPRLTSWQWDGTVRVE